MVNRFTDPGPFTPLSELSPQAREWHLKVAAAQQRYTRTGDPTELQELGALPTPMPGQEKAGLQDGQDSSEESKSDD